MMDERKDRIGAHAAASALPWAVAALGPVPEDQPDRLEWLQRAASIGAYRELSGHAHPTDPIGPEPITGTPDLRAARHEALAALGPEEGTGVRGMPDGMLLHLRDTYPIPTPSCAGHPGRRHPPLRSAEPPPPTREEPTLSAAEDIARTSELVAELPAQRRELARQFSERKPQPLPAPSSAGFSPGFPARAGQARDAILQPPRPQIEPSPRTLERVPGHGLDLEAAD